MGWGRVIEPKGLVGFPVNISPLVVYDEGLVWVGVGWSSLRDGLGFQHTYPHWWCMPRDWYGLG